MVRKWLVTGMFRDEPDPDLAATKVLDELSSHALTKSHSRHISMAKAVGLGIKVLPLEDDPKLQDLVLTAHHACTQTLADTPAFKIIENQNGISFITSVVSEVIPPFQAIPASPAQTNSPPVSPDIAEAPPEEPASP